MATAPSLALSAALDVLVFLVVLETLEELDNLEDLEKLEILELRGAGQTASVAGSSSIEPSITRNPGERLQGSLLLSVLVASVSALRGHQHPTLK